MSGASSKFADSAAGPAASAKEDGGEGFLIDEKVPVRMLMELMALTRDKEFEKALDLAREILELDPKQPKVLQYVPLLEAAISDENGGADSDDDDDDDDDGDDNDDDDDAANTGTGSRNRTTKQRPTRGDRGDRLRTRAREGKTHK